MAPNIEYLQKTLDETFQKIGRQRRIILISKAFVYGLSLLYMLFVITAPMNGKFFVHDYEANPNPTFFEANPIIMYIIPVFVIIMIGSFIFSFAAGKYKTMEENTVQYILYELFPSIDYSMQSTSIKRSLLLNSLFFNSLSPEDVEKQVFSTMTLGKLEVYDLGIAKPSAKLQIIAYFQMLWQVFRLTTSSNYENAAFSFRGMFAWSQLPKKINGSIIILPDHLEGQLGYIAQNIQSMKSIEGNKLVKLEDVTFEKYFSVYSNDEILARYILTPLMMSLMTQLREKYNREIMLSFNGDKFYFGVAMPEGILTTGGKGINSIQAIYDNIQTAQNLIQNLKL